MDEGQNFMILAVRLMVSREQSCLHTMSVNSKGFFGGSLLITLLTLCRDPLHSFPQTFAGVTGLCFSIHKVTGAFRMALDHL